MDIEFFVSLESDIWDALVCGDKQTEDRLIANDFIGVYDTGFSNKAEYLTQLDHGPAIHSYKISLPQLITIDTSNVILIYKADFIPQVSSGAGEASAMYVTSMWSLRSGVWVNVFSQDTTAES